MHKPDDESGSGRQRQNTGDDGISRTDPVIPVNAINPQDGARGASSQQQGAEQEILDRVKAGERWMIALTFLIFLTAAFQAYETWTNNNSTSKQVDKIIKAANQIQGSAKSFSQSAEGINSGVRDAVGKLNLQAGATNMLAQQSRKALQANIRSERAWIGVQNFNLTRYEPGMPVEFTYDLVNSGKTPALNVRLAVRGDHIFEADWSNRQMRDRINQDIATRAWQWDLATNTTITPQGVQPHIFTSPKPLSHDVYDRVVKPRIGFPYILGRVEYDDVSGNHQWMTFCFNFDYDATRQIPSWNYCRVGNDMSYEKEK